MNDRQVLRLIDLFAFAALLGALIRLNNTYHLSVWEDLMIGAVAWFWAFHGYLRGFFAGKDDE